MLRHTHLAFLRRVQLSVCLSLPACFQWRTVTHMQKGTCRCPHPGAHNRHIFFFNGTRHTGTHTCIHGGDTGHTHTHTRAGKPEVAVNLFSAFSHPGLSFLKDPPGAVGSL